MSVICLTDGQRPVSSLCSHVLCPPRHVCRVIQQCANPILCPPIPICVPCVPKGVDDLCNRNGFCDTLLTVFPGNPFSLQPRTCPERNCPYDSVCIVDGITRMAHCCYNRVPLPTTKDPICM
nr:hypothetical protein BgiMline_026799 [Biomphalaria glabrata]